MRRMLNTLFVTTQGAWISQKGENIIVHLSKEESRAFPIHLFESILCFGQVNVTAPAMGFCAEHGVNLAFFTEYGKFIARVQGEVHGNVLLRREQYRIADNETRCVSLVRNILLGKLLNSKIVLQRSLRDHQQDADTGKSFKNTCALLDSYILQIKNLQSISEMRGIEGIAAKNYFDLLNFMIIQQKEDFKFIGRNRRPPTDNVNAMLSYVYTLLSHDITSALEAVGLDPAVGFLHTDRSGRPSLALDLMEEFRTWLADRFVLSLINMKQIKSNGFTLTPSGAVVMNNETRKTIIAEWQSRKQDELTHPFTGEKIQIGNLAYLQSMLLARYIRGDIKEYPAFVWR